MSCDVQGGSVVRAAEGWYAFEEMKSGSRRSEMITSNATVIRTYACPLGACAGNNTCLGNRTGLLCGRCPDGFAIELNVCAECASSGSAGSALQAVLAVIAAMVVGVILFLIGWRMVVIDNMMHRAYDSVVTMLGKYIQSLLVNSSKAEDAVEAYNLFKDPNIRKHLPQASKIIIGRVSTVLLCSS